MRIKELLEVFAGSDKVNNIIIFTKDDPEAHRIKINVSLTNERDELEELLTRPRLKDYKLIRIKEVKEFYVSVKNDLHIIYKN